MTLGEQKIALPSYPQIEKAETLILSGILNDQITNALEIYSPFGFSLVSTLEKDSWVALILQRS